MNLGKKNVLCESYVDGVLNNSRTIFTTVYRKADGTLQINYMGSKTSIERRPDGWLYHRRDVRSLRKTNLRDIL